MIMLTKDGTIEPFGLAYDFESEFMLIAPTRDMVSERDADGEIDFGTEFNDREIILRGRKEFNTPMERRTFREQLALALQPLFEPQPLISQWKQDKRLMVWLYGKPEIVEHPSWVEVILSLKAKPFYESVDENELEVGPTGEDVIIDSTIATPPRIEISGIVVDPIVSINGVEISYTGSLAEADVLVFDCEHQTATFNGINALEHVSGSFPKLRPGTNQITAPSTGTTKIYWRDRWL